MIKEALSINDLKSPQHPTFVITHQLSNPFDPYVKTKTKIQIQTSIIVNKIDGPTPPPSRFVGQMHDEKSSYAPSFTQDRVVENESRDLQAMISQTRSMQWK